MAEDLQGLLEKIHDENIQKANDEKDKIVSDAKAQAEKIIADAKEEAESIRRNAEADAGKSEERAKAAIQQAARDIILSLKSELLERLDALVKGAIGEAMTGDFMGKILMEMVKNYAAANPNSDPGIEVLIAKKDLEEMQKLLAGSLVNDLKSKPDISVGHDFASGLKVGFKENDIFLDFTDDAISDIICSFVGPRLTALMDTKSNQG